MRLKLTISYDGRPYDGWQSQPSGNTVQDLLEKAASETAKQNIKVHGSGRTDAGVHAFCQVAHFDAPDHLSMNPFNWVPALNTKLPPSIRVLTAEEVSGDFHARFSAKGKTYRYDVSTEPVLSPFRSGMAWHIPRQLDPYLLEDAMKLTLGRHDFEAFCARRGNETDDTDHHRTLTEASLQPLEFGWRLTWSGDGFLYKMVRILTGSAIKVAEGRLRLDDYAAYLDQGDGLPYGRSSHCAPADGLFLMEVNY